MIASFTNAQEVKNIHFEQDGKMITIYYDLLGATYQAFDVKVKYSLDEGQTWFGPLVFVSGDVGNNQKPGVDKKIMWDVLNDTENLSGDLMFKIDAVQEKDNLGLVYIKGGAFWMGSNTSENNQKPKHLVNIGDFYISKYEITNKQYCKFLNNISFNKNGPKYIVKKNSSIFYENNKFYVIYGQDNWPVVGVTWHGANDYCEWAGGRLPTEAEWEYIAIGGSNTNDPNVNNPNLEFASINLEYANAFIYPVGQTKSNKLGIYDMKSNVSEWCSDWYNSNYYSKNIKNNPKGPDKGTSKVVRGKTIAGWNNLDRGQSRNYKKPNRSDVSLGFRFAKDIN